MTRGKLEALREAGVYLREGEAAEDISLFLDECRGRSAEDGGISQKTREVADEQRRWADEKGIVYGIEASLPPERE